MAKKNMWTMIAGILLIIGGINWGLVGSFNFNLVELIFGSVSWLLSLVYILVGLSGIYMIFAMGKK